MLQIGKKLKKRDINNLKKGYENAKKKKKTWYQAFQLPVALRLAYVFISLIVLEVYLSHQSTDITI